MKLRFDKNSLRLRVKRSDLEKLREHHFILETIDFPNGAFEYKLTISDHIDEISAWLQGQSIEVNIPSGIAASWMNSDETGIYHSLPLGMNSGMEIIIEKDFPCKDRPDEDKSDYFTELAEEAPVKC